MERWNNGFSNTQHSNTSVSCTPINPGLPVFQYSSIPYTPNILGPKKVSYLLADAATQPLFQLEPNAQEPVAEKPGEGR